MSLESIGPLAWLIPASTALAFLAIVVLIARGGGGRIAGQIGVGGIFASMVVGLAVFVAALGQGGEALAHEPFVRSVPWLPLGATSLNVGWYIDPLSAVTTAMVTVVCLMIFIFSTAYMEGELTAYRDPRTGAVAEGTGRARYARFFAYISLFATGMLGFVLSSNLLEALMFWEVMGLCSFLLIGFWYHKPSAAAAAKKAFLTTRIGDLFFFLGILALFAAVGSLDYAELLKPETLEKLQGMAPLTFGGVSIPILGLIALLIFGGAVGKSAQFPLHVWLPDAMEGPTPVSALIHAATMVAAGVYLVARMFPVFAAGGEHLPGEMTTAMWVVAGIGAFTALFAATIGAAQFDIKRVLAYSTVSQLGYMIMALGIGAYVAAVFHVITHAFFKALLFLGSGSVIHGVEHGMHHGGHHDGDGQSHHADGDEPGSHGLGLSESPARMKARLGLLADPADPHDPQDMRNMGGLRTRMPITFWTFLIGTLALTGIPVFAGFWSKDEILAEAFAKGPEGGLPIALFVYACGTLAAFLTAFYMSRQVFMVFGGPPQTEGAKHATESAPAMTYPLMFLAFFAAFLGFVAVPTSLAGIGPLLGNPFHHFVGHVPFTGAEFPSIPFNAIPALISVLVALAGWGLGWYLYTCDPVAARIKDPLMALGGPWTILNRKFYVDEIYSATVVRGSVLFSQLNALVDSRLVDGAVNGAGIGGNALSRLNGWVDTYVVDGSVNLVGMLNSEFSRGLRSLQSGRVQQYLLVVLFGLVLLVGAYLF